MPLSLCPGCVHVRLVTGRRGQTYLLCRNDAIADKYPPQPVVSCPGYAPRPAAPPGTARPDRIVGAGAPVAGACVPAGRAAADAVGRRRRTRALRPDPRGDDSAGLVRNGGVLAEITLNVANVTVEPLVDSTVPAGDFVALSISGGGDWHPEATVARCHSPAVRQRRPGGCGRRRGRGLRLHACTRSGSWLRDSLLSPGSRGGGVLYKVIWLVRFNKDKSREEVLQWWRGHHAELAAATPGMVRYRPEPLDCPARARDATGRRRRACVRRPCRALVRVPPDVRSGDGERRVAAGSGGRALRIRLDHARRRRARRDGDLVGRGMMVP